MRCGTNSGRMLGTVVLAILMMSGCMPEATEGSRRAMPAVAAAHFNQLSAGNGARIYNLSVDGELFASVLITGDAVGDSRYATNREYWRIRSGLELTTVRSFRLDTAWSGTQLTRKAAQHMFEAPTKGWLGWEVPRGFTLDRETRVLMDAPAEQRHLFSVYGPAPAGLWTNPDIDTFLEYHVLIDLSGDVPDICWALSADSFATYEAARDYISDESTTIVSTWGMRSDAREVLFFGASKAIRIEQGEGFVYSAVY